MTRVARHGQASEIGDEDRPDATRPGEPDGWRRGRRECVGAGDACAVDLSGLLGGEDVHVDLLVGKHTIERACATFIVEPDETDGRSRHANDGGPQARRMSPPRGVA